MADFVWAADLNDLRRLIPKLDALKGEITVLTAVVERLIGEMIGLRIELQAMRERWEAGGDT